MGGTLAFACEYAATSVVGAYEITPSGLTSNNYEISYAKNNKVTVANATMTDVNVAQAAALTYNNGLQTATVSAVATVINDQKVTFTYAVEENGAYSEAVPSFKDAGTYTVYFKANAANHDEETGSFAVTIDKKAITVTADDKATFYKDSLAALTWTGAIEEGDVVCTASTDANINKVGVYTITLTSTNNANYDVTLVNGTYTVKEAKTEITTDASGEKKAESYKDIKAEDAKSESGVSIKDAVVSIYQAAQEANVPVVTLELKIGEEATVAFDKAALEKLAAKDDVKITYTESKGADIDQGNKNLKGAELVLEISLNGATFDGGKATISTAFENKAPAGKKAVVYYIDENGKKTDMKATFADGKVTFETTHFSTYVVKYVLATGTIVGIIAGGVVVLAAIVVLVILLLKKKGGKKGGEKVAEAKE